MVPHASSGLALRSQLRASGEGLIMYASKAFFVVCGVKINAKKRGHKMVITSHSTFMGKLFSEDNHPKYIDRWRNKWSSWRGSAWEDLVEHSQWCQPLFSYYLAQILHFQSLKWNNKSIGKVVWWAERQAATTFQRCWWQCHYIFLFMQPLSCNYELSF